jgi:hypothetical protein
MRTRVVVDGIYGWSDNEPQVAVGHQSAFGSRPVEVIGHMLQVIHPTNYQKRARPTDPSTPSISPENTLPRCSHLLQYKGAKWQAHRGERCDRAIGHADGHRSRRVMDKEALRRRVHA